MIRRYDKGGTIFKEKIHYLTVSPLIGPVQLCNKDNKCLLTGR